MTSQTHKTFNIGFHKTGTTSLDRFMHEHGYRTLHNTAYSMQRLNLGSQQDAGEDDGKAADLISLIDPALLDALVSEFDFFSDNPWPLLYRQLDARYPGSSFILTRRNIDAWMRSLLDYTGTERTRMRKLIYGYGNPHQNITRYRQVYLRHYRDVAEYFADRNNLLVLDIEDDNTSIAARLRDFLGLRDSNIAFPVTNRKR